MYVAPSSLPFAQADGVARTSVRYSLLFFALTFRIARRLSKKKKNQCFPFPLCPRSKVVYVRMIPNTLLQSQAAKACPPPQSQNDYKVKKNQPWSAQLSWRRARARGKVGLDRASRLRVWNLFCLFSIRFFFLMDGIALGVECCARARACARVRVSAQCPLVGAGSLAT